jgi:hypothetical protein
MHRKFPLTIFALILAGEAYPQNRGGDFQLIKISRDFITTPQINYSGAEQQRETRERWLRVDVQFSSAPNYTDELTFKYYILVGGNVLPGEVTHANVLGGRDHHSVMYVPPHALAFVLQNRPLTAAAVENVAVQIVQKGEIKDELSLNRGRPRWHESLPTAPGLVLNKNETPFASLFWDHYEQIKTADH